MPKKAPAKAPSTIVETKKPAAKRAKAAKATKATKATKAVKAPKAAKPAKAAAPKARVHKAAGSAVFLDPETYNAHIEGMMAQGLDRSDAVDTLRVGIREANGLRVPQQLLSSIAQHQQAAAA